MFQVDPARRPGLAPGLLALISVLLLYPAWVFLPLPWDEWVLAIYRGDRSGWWAFWLALIISHLPPVLVVWWAVRSSGEGWSSIGLDWSWFVRRWWIAGPVSALFAIAALTAPLYLYGGDLPARSETMFMMPIAAPERLFVLLGAMVAGVTEEIMFRGFLITRLARRLPSPWIAVVIQAVAFAAIHSLNSPSEWMAYIAVGAAFGAAFVLMKMRRLELLIAVHFVIDAFIALAP